MENYKELVDWCKETSKYLATMGETVRAEQFTSAGRAITELLDRAEKAERERDAAVSDISKIIAKTEWIRMVYGIDDPNTDMRLAELCCGYCSNCGEDCYEQGDDYQCVNFKWNGGRNEHGTLRSDQSRKRSCNAI